jgi:hypothetical protein
VSTSADKRILRKRALVYLAVSAFLVVFNLIYSLFAHGVASAYMQYAFLIPLAGGSLVALLLMILPQAGYFTCQIWRMGIATLIVGFLLHGVFDIYGSGAPLVTGFFIAGGVLLAAALAFYIAGIIRAKR